ncbi:MAG: TIGR04100 family radical SAM protein [Ruminococcus sp.]|nr:TIGR04100 family radical SAM protein [Ruminococcus sp.]MCD7800521.1 TIGR04100 family radical SAM protein [Ruminococcus sp.]
MTILYEVGKNLYVNVTNRCPCACTFCIRNNGDGAYGSDSLWLDREPSLEEIISAFKQRNLSKYNEVVFCGYGEPLERVDVVVEACKYLRENSNCKIRINTNGLANLIHNRNIVPELKGCFDIISVSLNAGCEESYLKVTRPKFKEGSYHAMLEFAKECKNIAPKVIFSVVDVISKEEIELSQNVADSLQIPLRIRKYDT